VAQGALAGALPGRRAHPRPGHVPQAADPRRRPPVRASPCSASTSTPRRRTYVVEWLDPELPVAAVPPPVPRPGPDGTAWGIRLALAEVKGINEGEVDRIVAARRGSPTSLTDFWHRAPGVSADRRAAGAGGGFDSLYDIGAAVASMASPAQPDHPPRPAAPGRRARPPCPRPRPAQGRSLRGPGLRRGPPGRAGHPARRRRPPAATAPTRRPATGGRSLPERHALAEQGVWARASAQAQRHPAPRPVDSVQLASPSATSPARRSPACPR
jgi:error-prone DNA polymerase